MAYKYNHDIVHCGEKQHRFNPYVMNGGSIMAVAGDDFSVIAADSRLSLGFTIFSRDHPKTVQLTPTTVVAMAGFEGDILTFKKHAMNNVETYQHDHGDYPSTPAVASMLSKMLYYRRFFPYYVYNIVAGLDQDGKGCVYSYDPVGSYERERYRAAGAANELIQPLLDNQIGGKNMTNPPPPLTEERARRICIDCFISAAERDITTGDSVYVYIIKKDGVKSEKFDLRRD